MDLSLDPPPAAEPIAPLPAAVAAVHSANAANPVPTQPSAVGHPSYAEMITAAIAALNENNGSSKRAVANYIESNFSNLPPNHSVLLTHHLKRLRDNGQVLMVKHSYTLPGSAPAPHVSANGTASHPAASPDPKRRPGRPPKLKPVQAAVPVFAEQPLVVNPVPSVVPGQLQPQNESTGQLGSVYIAVEPGLSGNKRGRGRPPKLSGARPSPNSSGAPSGVGRGRGRPKKNAVLRSRGRPRKLANVEGGVAAGDALPVDGGGVAPVAGKRRGRPPRAGGVVKKPRKLSSGEPRKPRKLSGKPLGRPRKNASATSTPVNHLLMAYLDLKGKLEHFQSTIKRAVIVLKPDVNSETAVTALQELETLSAMDLSTSNVQPQS